MSYTLRGRLESRLAAALLPLLAALALAAAVQEWWPLVLAGLMVGVGVALDVTVYHPALPYQPGWTALPLGALELGLVMTAVLAAGVAAPLETALALFGGSWLLAQVLAHAGFPLARLSYGDDGGELGRAGPVAAAAVLAVFAGAGGVAYGTRPPTVHLSAGVTQGPLVLDETQTLVGEPGAVVRGGIVVTADDVEIRGVRVLGGEYGIAVDGARSVVIEDVAVLGAVLDGINVRRASVSIRDCRIESLQSPVAQGIDISFGFDLAPSLVEGCTVTGGREGIVSHFAKVDLRENRVAGTTLRGITVTEMSDGTVEGNAVENSLGIAIFCGDYSACAIEGNEVSGTKPDAASGDGSRLGYGIVAHFGAKAILGENTIRDSPGGIGAFVDARIEHQRD